ncbi:MAG: galactose oxidase [Acidobacteriota bacterium]|nr:galactose oxidase [Acidobacteriota bacterium]
MKTMNWLLAGSLIFHAVSPELFSMETDRPNWVRAVEHAPWTPRDSCGEFVFRGKMWLVGGWVAMNGPGPRDVWSSSDGADWTRGVGEAPWTHADLSTSLVYDGKMWLMGGWCGGRDASASASNAVWFSEDGANWTCATKAAAWTARLGAGGVVFDGKMWILGGLERYFDGSPEALRNDVWFSTDGKTWTRAVEKAPWAPRAFHGAVVFDDKIWVMGGGNYRPEFTGYNDVWNSADGVNWTKVTEHAPWAGRIWFSADIYRNRIWIMGGWSDKPSVNWNDVWYTRDGRTWNELKTEAVWSKRHEQSFYVFADQFWIAGGNEWPLVNDVWRIDIPESFLREKK